ncbi:DUF3990 domain-containing protein [Nocardia sp. NPDC057272]|uniref:DUF3990 domain-containing protein n=1 Tax=Nocardia sp. NPDC057272 TaxID=3346079 RepID=UPI003626E482
MNALEPDPTGDGRWLQSLSPIGAGSRERDRQPRVFNHSGMTPAAAARAYNRVLSGRALDSAGENLSDVQFVNDKGPTQPGVNLGWVPPTDKKPPEQPGVSAGWTPPADTKPLEQPVAPMPPQTPTTSPTAPNAVPNQENSNPPAPQTVTQPPIPGLLGAMTGTDPATAAVLAGATPDPGNLPAPLVVGDLANLQPGESTRFDGATVTATPDGGRTTNAVDPTTGTINTTVWNMHSSVVLTSQSTPVPGTNGNSWETTATHADGSVSEIFSVSGPGGITTWTANPDGSRSVQYPDGSIINEPPSGSSLPVIVTQLDPDGSSGHTVAYFPDGRVVESAFRPSAVLGTPVTDVFGSDGEHVNVLTVPGRANGAPFSIVTGNDGNRTVVGPDNSVTPIDRYNNAIGGPNTWDHFDPFTASWNSDKISHRGPMSYAPDGTATQPWYYVGKGGELRTVIAQFDKNNQLAMLTDSDYKGITWSAFETIDGISVPKQSGALDAGNVEDNAILVFELATLVDLPFAAVGWGARIGARWYGSQLAGHGASLTARELAVSQLSSRGLTGVTTGASITALERLRAAIGSRNSKPDYIASSPRAALPTKAKPIPAQTIATPEVYSVPIQSGSTAGSRLPASQTGILSSAHQRLGAGRPLSEVLTAETVTARAAHNLVAEIEHFSLLQAEAARLASASARTPAARQALRNNADNAGRTGSRHDRGTAVPGPAGSSISEPRRSAGGGTGRPPRLSGWHTRWPFGGRGRGTDPEIVFYHGTTEESATIIRNSGISLGLTGLGKLDFGPGFYTSRDVNQALKYAQSAINRNPGSLPGLVEFRVPQSELSNLTRLNFSSADGEWVEFISRFRRAEPPRGHSFDIVEGPILANLPKYLRGADPTGSGTQTSWHTNAAIDVLNRYIV